MTVTASTPAATATASVTPVPATSTPSKTPLVPTATPSRTPTTPPSTSTATPVLPTATATGSTPSSLTLSLSTSAPAKLAGGASTTLRVTLTNKSATLTNGVVDLEMYNAANQRVGQQSFSGQSLSTGHAMHYSWAWTAPAQAGVYQLRLGVFGQNWAPTLYWNNQIASTTVSVPPAATPVASATATPAATITSSGSSLSFTVQPAASTITATHGAPATLKVSVTGTGATLMNGIVDLEVYDASGTKVAQQFFDNQTLASGKTHAYSWSWTTPSQIGTYVVRLGVFGQNWSPMYTWNNQLVTVNVR